ncbi:anaphase promoting complex subunit CDC23 NDAI_0C03350 [Naumovozyma dairenensis CBS 421]|uniref:Cdc23 domain-containing protein n=1 Tax=Naumovozyma dairenensis (strain ATCC 10597 / BCRC 20456 / CBS 421 / NBRC 0211 / NRRL Y-12639) TaxID=1071378 RepID=G0W884_NAUDC|nr:hypothetical protein NDAI_0C03350 [Naumovozyma dairenensis CBS 421]CCD23995.1 hypothetical protein NDAI_0C03350 [Naumovozyma dairenensis CBS 421]
MKMDDDSQLKLIQDIKINLRRSASDLSHWKLYKSAKWSSEALIGMCDISPFLSNKADPVNITYESPLRNRTGMGRLGNDGKTNNNGKMAMDYDPRYGMNDDEYDLYLLAVSLFDCKEFDRCCYFLKDVKHPCLKFLKLYSKFISWDKKNQESVESVLTVGKSKNIPTGINDPEGASSSTAYDFTTQAKKIKTSRGVVNMGDGHQSSISLILQELNRYLDDLEKHDDVVSGRGLYLGLSLLYYLKGVLLKQEGNKSSAMSSFLKSLSHYSFNWTCWIELTECLSRADEAFQLLKYLDDKFVIQSEVPFDTQHTVQYNIMLKFFKLTLSQDYKGNMDELMDLIETLLAIFPNFAYIKAQNALINYHYMDYLSSEDLFEQIVKLDPYRLDDLDTYSNILYVMQRHSKLAYLAQFVSQVDKFRPETCCIIANYYSARQEHEKSIMYFRRALTLNKSCTSAWTLMGHEFVELKNSHAAIECYRRAVDINPKDFKAWYGLGQAYEVLEMHLYSLFYFQKACSLQPLDRRMWQALGTCYIKIGYKSDALKCFERALQHSGNIEQDSVLLFKIAEICEQLKQMERCKLHMIRCVELEKSEDGFANEETIKARLWLAKYELKHDNYEEAYKYATAVTNGTAQEVELARSIARHCQTKM